MGHLSRVAALLLGLLGVVLAIFVLPRLMSTPRTLEAYGFYLERDNAQEWADWPMQYAELLSCTDCHKNRYNTWAKSKHSAVSCESCHGPGKGHVDEGVSLSVDVSRESCGLCHARIIARPSSFPQVDLGEHGGQSVCVACHDPHNPVVAQAPRIPHALQGQIDCNLCHGAGKIKPLSETHAGRSPDICLNCHRVN